MSKQLQIHIQILSLPQLHSRLSYKLSVNYLNIFSNEFSNVEADTTSTIILYCCLFYLFLNSLINVLTDFLEYTRSNKLHENWAIRNLRRMYFSLISWLDKLCAVWWELHSLLTILTHQLSTCMDWSVMENRELLSWEG